MTSKKIIFISAAIVALMFVGCKPTENNYRNAYDAAVAKREQAAAEQMRPASGLLSDDGPMQRVVNGDTVYVLNERVSMLDGGAAPDRWGVAVGIYKMDTNARASAEDIMAAGFGNAFVARGTEGRFFTIAATAHTLETAKEESERFRKQFPDYPYVGLPAAPVLIAF